MTGREMLVEFLEDYRSGASPSGRYYFNEIIALLRADGPVGLDGTQFNFKVGDLVQKKTGYLYPGQVVAAFLTRRGYRRYAVEALHQDFDSMLHIFSEEQLTVKIEPPKPSRLEGHLMERAYETDNSDDPVVKHGDGFPYSSS